MLIYFPLRSMYLINMTLPRIMLKYFYMNISNTHYLLLSCFAAISTTIHTYPSGATNSCIYATYIALSRWSFKFQYEK